MTDHFGRNTQGFYVVTKLDGYRGYLQARIAAARPDWIPATVLFEELRAMGYSGCLTSVRSYARAMKPPTKTDPVVRFETDPGQQMQVDWGSFRLNDRRISLFLGTLGWSRFSYGVFVDNERFDTLSHCHEMAFEQFGSESKPASHPRELLRSIHFQTCYVPKWF